MANYRDEKLKEKYRVTNLNENNVAYIHAPIDTCTAVCVCVSVRQYFCTYK